MVKKKIRKVNIVPLLSSFTPNPHFPCSHSFSTVTVTGKPFFIVSSLSHRWLFGWEGCRFYGWAGFFFGCGSLITMTVVSLDRYLKICHLRYGGLGNFTLVLKHVKFLIRMFTQPVKYLQTSRFIFNLYRTNFFRGNAREYLSFSNLFSMVPGTWLKRHHAFLCLALVWAYAAFWATMPLVGWGSYAPEPFGTSCTLDWWLAQASVWGQSFVMAILFFCLILPTGIIVFSYVMIIFKVKSSAKEISHFDARIRNSHSLEIKLTKVS